MATASDWQAGIMARLSDWADAVIAFLPSLAAAAGLLLAGWLVARLLRGGTVRLARTFDRGLAGLGRHRPLSAGAGPDVLGAAVFWLVILAAITAATQVLALDSFSAWLGRLIAQLPTLLTGGLILAAGFFLSVVARNLTNAAVPASLPQAALLGRLLQAAILVTALVLGVDQMGLDVTFLVTLGTVLAGTLAGGLALAVSLGSGTFVSNLIAAHHLRRRFRIGQLVQAGGYEGRIVELTPVSLVLDCPDGRVHLPAKLFLEGPVVAAAEEPGDG
jgi:small-conductance mechanosensitive channel